MIVSGNSVSIKGNGALSRRVLDFEAALKHLVQAARKPGFTSADWAPLAEFAAVDEFERVPGWKS
jgi:hypothetical protein